MDSEFRLCPACRAPNTAQDAACAACGAALPKVVMGPPPAFDEMPGRQEARQAAGSGVRRGLLVGVAGAAILGLLVVRTFRSSALQVDSAQTTTSADAAPEPVTTPQPAGIVPGASVPAAPAGWSQPNPYASPGMTQPGMAQPGVQPGMTSDVAAAPVSGPASSAATVPAMIIAAPAGRARPSPSPDARGAGKAASYTDADLARVRTEAEAEASGTAPAPAPPAPAVAGALSPAGGPAPAPASRAAAPADSRARSRSAAVREAQQRVEKAQVVVDDIRREARDNDDDGLQEELKDAESELKAAQRDLARAIRQQEKSDRDDRTVPPPQ